MSELIRIFKNEQNSQIVVSSRDVADHFGKRHDHVLENIVAIGNQMSTPEFSGLFYETFYVAKNGKRNPEYLMNRDGFSLLAMGFTGKKALEWKLKYIQAFNAMEAQQATAPAENLSHKEALYRLVDSMRETDREIAEVAAKQKAFESDTMELCKIGLNGDNLRYYIGSQVFLQVRYTLALTMNLT